MAGAVTVTGAAGHLAVAARATRAWQGKAETLELLRAALRTAVVPRLVHFTLDEWRRSPNRVLARIAEELRCERAAVRSSARTEDGLRSSLAGHYLTRLDVRNDPSDLTVAIEEVFAALPGDRHDRIIVQEMFAPFRASGVVVSHDPDTGAPYYLVEYDDASTRPDRVTAGVAIPKTAVVHRDLPAARVPRPLARLLRTVGEIEQLWPGSPLEMEFAQDAADDVAVLQARPLVLRARREERRAVARQVEDALAELAVRVSELSARRPGVVGRQTVLGQMPDWNPAELIGAKPAPLALSLFERLISDRVWQEARAALGYRAVPGVPLVVALAGRPYVDVRASFNSFLPAGVVERTGEALVDAWLGRLRERPELHDRVEFEVVHTALDFSFGASFRERYGTLLQPSRLEPYVDALRGLTAAAVRKHASGTLARALASVERLAPQDVAAAPPDWDGSTACLRRSLRLLERCRRAGTIPFAIVARHAFIAEALLRSAVTRGALTSERLDELRASHVTVAGELGRDFVRALCGGSSRRLFLHRYGHLRPGTFDVVSLRYDQRPELFDDATLARVQAPRPRPRFVPVSRELDALSRLLRESGLGCGAEDLLRYARGAVVGRERAKFLFSRLLSDALEGIAAWAARRGLSREDASFLTLDDLTLALRGRGREDGWLRDVVEQSRTRLERLAPLRLGTLIRDPGDLTLQIAQPATPTFVTSRSVTARPLRIDGRAPAGREVACRIVCIESADPGFDWLFAYRIAGLVTEFGGGNSHMAIRCIELGVPAAIGVGHDLFERVAGASYVELRCAERALRPGCPVASA